jgi:DNA-binding NarL/FixJ family response regulator
LRSYEDGRIRRSDQRSEVASCCYVDELLRALRKVAAGGSYIDPVVVNELVGARSRQQSSPLRFLTAREREVLIEVASGCSNTVVASRLTISDRAVEKHINSIFSKLGLTESPDLHRRVTAVLLLLQDTR